VLLVMCRRAPFARRTAPGDSRVTSRRRSGFCAPLWARPATSSSRAPSRVWRSRAPAGSRKRRTVSATPFAIAKLAASSRAGHVLSAGMSASILRYATVYGPGETGHGVVSKLIQAVLVGQPPVIDGDGLDEHDYIHVADAAEATLRRAAAPRRGRVTTSDRVGTTTLDLARLV